MKHFSKITKQFKLKPTAWISTFPPSTSPSVISPQKRTELKTEDIRGKIAPWISIGGYSQGLLSHLSTSDIVRALSVLRMCSYDFVVSRSSQLFDISTKFGPLGEAVLRKTFFDQFVGGDTISRMRHVVSSMQQRGLVLMVLPVLEEDVEDAQSSKKTYDDNLQSLISLAEMTSSLEKRKPIIQLKMSAIMPAVTLEKVSQALLANPANYKFSARPEIVTQIANCVERPENFEQQLQLDKDDLDQFVDGFKRADIFVKHSEELGVNVVVDAELYSCKPAISAMALALMTRYNASNSIVGNTIQGYLKDAVPTIESELKVITKDIAVNWYGKIVRGAYMDRERNLAKKNGYPSPICDNYEATSSSYNRAVRIVMQNLNTNPDKKSHLLVATHNEVSIRLAAQTMAEFKMLPQDERISFAQIYGMADYLSTPLVNMNYHVYKSTPYGPIGKVMPYLARRASENRSVMEGAREEREMLWKELKVRMKMH